MNIRNEKRLAGKAGLFTILFFALSHDVVAWFRGLCLDYGETQWSIETLRENQAY